MSDPTTAGIGFTDPELTAIRLEFGAHGHADCPRCGVRLDPRPIGGGSFGLGYRRRREWLICPRCRRSAVFDIKRGTRN